MEKMYLELVKGIRDAVREKALEIPKFKDAGNGAIRISAYPCCKEADDWLGGLSTFGRELNPYAGIARGCDDIVDYEHVFAITEGGSCVVVTGVQDAIEQKGSCYAYTALKIAHCSHAQDLGAGQISGIDLGDTYLTERNGYGPYLGALCVEVYRRRLIFEELVGYFLNGGSPQVVRRMPFCGVYVCVSGAKARDDLKCAFAAIDVIEKFFKSEPDNFELNVPEFPKD